MATVPPLLTADQVAAIAQVDRRTAYRWMYNQQIPTFRRGRIVRCPTKELEKALGFEILSSHLVTSVTQETGDDAEQEGQVQTGDA